MKKKDLKNLRELADKMPVAYSGGQKMNHYRALKKALKDGGIEKAKAYLKQFSA